MSEEEKIHFDGGMAEEKKRERRKRGEKEACFHLLAHVPNVHKSRC